MRKGFVMEGRRMLWENAIARLSAFWRDESGVAMLETVFVFPLQLLLTMLIVQVAMIFVGANVVNYAAFQGARTALVTVRGEDVDRAAKLAADRAAWIVCSTLHNTTNSFNRPERQKMRLFEYNYYFPKDISKRLWSRLKLYPTEDKPEESMLEYELQYWMPLMVPLGSQALDALMPSGDDPGCVRDIDGAPSLCLEQRNAIGKTWPY